MRIGLLSPPWLPVPPPRYGGTEAIIDRLARGLSSVGHDVVLFATGDSTCPVPRQWVYEEAQRHRLGQVMTELRHVVRGYATLQDCEIVHDHTIAGPLYAIRYPDLPVVMTAHGPFDDEFQDVYDAIGERVPLIAISRHQASTARRPPAAVIYHGIDVDECAGGTGQGGYYAWIGRMAPYKGAREAALIARGAGVRLLLAAKMDEPAELEYFHGEVEPLIGDDVECVGEVGDAERTQLLGGAIGLINPISWDEPFGLVMAEAMSCGTPVLAFAHGSAPELVGEGVGGLLCRDIEEAVRRLPELSSIDRTAVRDRAITLFSTERMVSQHVELYEAVIADRRRRPADRRLRPAPSASIVLDAPAESAEPDPVR